MKIGITCHTGSGGSGVLATELGIRLAARGHEIHFITREAPFRLRGFVENIFLHPVEALYYPLFQEPPHSLSLATKMAEVVLSADLDVLHVHYAIPHAVSAFLAKQMCNPRPLGIVTTLHGTDITLVGSHPSFKGITHFCIEQSDRVTAVSEFLREQTLQTFDVQRDIKVIHNFVDCKRFRPRNNVELRRRWVKDDELLIMHASNFRPVKNIGVLIDVFDSLQSQLNAKLILVGEGPEIQSAKTQIHRLGLDSRVVFLGNQQCMEDLLPLADLFLLPSHHESFGLSALEAMACGVVVIGTSKGGVREIIDDGVNGFLRHPADISGWAQAASEILRDPARRSAMSLAARETATERFCSDQIIESYENEYLAAIEQANTAMSMR